MHVIAAFLIGLVVGLGGGWFCHWRFASTLKAKVEQVETRIQKALKK